MLAHDLFIPALYATRQLLFGLSLRHTRRASGLSGAVRYPWAGSAGLPPARIGDVCGLPCLSPTRSGAIRAPRQPTCLVVRPTTQIVTTLKNKKPASQFARYIGPVLAAIRELGGSGRPDEVRTVIARDLRISDAEQSEPLPSGVQTRFENQVHWARFYLAKAGYIDSSQRGVWTLTEKGRSLGVITAEEIHRIIREVSEQTKPAPGSAPAPGIGTDEGAPLVADYREELARTLQGLPASGFERFCQRLLRESGFQEVTITGRSGDGGIDGIGILQVNALSASRSCFSARNTLAP